MFIKTMIYYQNSKTPSLISVCVKIKSDQNLRKMLLKMIQTMVVLYQELHCYRAKSENDIQITGKLSI